MQGKHAAAILLILLGACQTPRVIQYAEEPPPQASLEPAEGPPGLQGEVREIAGVSLPSLPEEKKQLPVSEELVEYYLGELSPQQKIGQRLISGIPGTKLTERAQRLVKDGYLGGVLLTRQNIADREQVKKLTSDLQELARENSPAIGLFVAVDQEGGRVSRLNVDNLTRFPPPHYWGGYQDPYYIEAVAYITAREALDLGCNLNLAPVLDLYALPDETIIGDRSMGAEAAEVAMRGLFYLQGARRAGIATVVKHFPGHGRTTVDTHLRLAVVDVDEQTLWEGDLLPFRLAIENNAEAVMTAHILYPQLDPEFPVTLSEKILRGLLRRRLGFEGLIISDDIEMGALARNYSSREIIKHSFRAGVDILLEFGSLDALKLIEEAMMLVESGELTIEQIDEGARRVLKLKIKYGLIPA